jgi:hypothetical protein
VVGRGPTPASPAVTEQVLPELATVHWRRRVDTDKLHRDARLWTAATSAHVVPFVAAAAGMVALQPLAAPVSAIALAHAWIIPELYAQRGANVVRPRRKGDAGAEHRSVGLLGDLIDHRARELHERTGLVLEDGALGTWLVGEVGALLVRAGGKRVHCYCVRAAEPDLPSGDRIAHLLLALRADEQGFATVANLAFSGARWRVRRRLEPQLRPALDEAVEVARTAQGDAPDVLMAG